jgi:C1A family cysteine protease
MVLLVTKFVMYPKQEFLKLFTGLGPFSLCINAENLGLLSAPYTTSCPGGQINHAVVLIGYDYKNNQNGQKSL